MPHRERPPSSFGKGLVITSRVVADEIEKIAPATKIILTSGYSPRMATVGTRSTRPFLSKPATRAQLARLVRSVLDG